MTAPQMTTLFTDLAIEDSSAIVKDLERQNIPYELKNDGAVVLPFGLFQVFHDFDKLNPTNDNFDVIRTMEYAASPLHYTFGRNSADAGQTNV